jgi:beta-alanine--pyruvate transaminase
MRTAMSNNIEGEPHYLIAPKINPRPARHSKDVTTMPDSATAQLQSNNLTAFWQPFTPNKGFQARPRLLARAEGMYYWDTAGRKVLDANSGLWCVNAGHCRKPIADAIAAQAKELDFAPTFQYGHPKAFQLANRLAELAPKGLGRVFFANSGSEAADSALKIARAYFRAKGDTKRYRFIGRERGYHGVNFGGLSVGGLPQNKAAFGPLLQGTEDLLPLPYDRAKQSFTHGEADGGANYADALEKILQANDPATFAAVIVEPMSGSGGVFVTPKAYLPRLRTLCDKYGVLLIFDEVITAFGRLGRAFGAERYGTTPDLLTFAKGVTNGAVPMGGVICKNEIYDAFVEPSEYSIALYHGYTYTGHPLAAAAGLATLDLYRDEGLFERARKLEPVFEEAMHSLKSSPQVIDIRNVGLAAAIELAPAPNAPGKRGYEALQLMFHEEGVAPRLSGDTLVFAPCLIASESDVGKMSEAMRSVLKRLN